MLEFSLLEQLATFAKYGTLSATAEKLHLSQSALSRSMQKLEELLDVTLFERRKNKISLNETGRMAAEYAIRLLAQEKDLVAQIRAFDRSQRTICLGCCAPIPHMELVSMLSQIYAGMTISSELLNDERLLAGLKEGKYHLVVLHQKPADSALHWVTCGKEKLYLSVPPAHPLASASGIWLKDLSGLSLLLYSSIGFWYDLCMEKIHNPRFLLQTDLEVFNELVSASALPCFATDVTMTQASRQENRITIPILDPEADVTYYCTCKKEDKARFSTLFHRLEHESFF